jgi:hypothetical protein
MAPESVFEPVRVRTASLVVVVKEEKGKERGAETKRGGRGLVVLPASSR